MWPSIGDLVLPRLARERGGLEGGTRMGRRKGVRRVRGMGVHASAIIAQVFCSWLFNSSHQTLRKATFTQSFHTFIIFLNHVFYIFLSNSIMTIFFPLRRKGKTLIISHCKSES